MKKSILAIILGSLFGLGLLFTVIGLLMGATMKSLHIVTNEKGLQFSNSSSGSSSVSQELPASQIKEIKNLDIDISAHSVEIYEGDNFSINGGFLTKNEIKDGTWHIEAKRKWNSVRIFGFLSIPVFSDIFDDERHTLTITIPKEHHFGEIKLDAAAVNIETNSLTCDKLACDVSAGSIQIDSLTASEADIDCSVGDISMKQYHISESGRFDCSMGNIELGNKHTIDDNLCNNFRADCSMGNISCYGMFTASGNSEKCRADCGMGNIDLHLKGTRDNYEFKSNASFGSLNYSGTGTDNQATTPTPVQLECNMGSIDISFY